MASVCLDFVAKYIGLSPYSTNPQISLLKKNFKESREIARQACSSIFLLICEEVESREMRDRASRNMQT